MLNWVEDKKVIMERTEKEILKDLEPLLLETKCNISASHTLDSRHNIFAAIVGDGAEIWLDIKMEIYDEDNDWVGDLFSYDTKDMSREALEQAVKEIVKYYYGEV